ncbi:MAG: phosphotransferase [Hyphomicrobiales bacterium]|nr:phosphotransferase [Hyphomicrobiales bacterium]MCP4999223.1 phosphotransferase [Hyphomicrobiales bacterium]
MTTIPDRIDDISAEWLTAIFSDSGKVHSAVKSAEVGPIGSEAGTLSSMARCRLSYKEPGRGGPENVVVKLMPEDPAVRHRAEELQGFEHEIRFYTEIASKIPLRVPVFYYGSCSNHRAALVLEDLGGLEFRDQIGGLSHRQTVAAARHIAGLHAQFWNTSQKEALGWIPVDDFAITQSYADAWPNFEKTYGGRIGTEAVSLGCRLGAATGHLLEAVARRPHTFCHGDYRADNLFFGDGGDPDGVVVIDWQLPTRSIGALDVARLMGASELQPEHSIQRTEPFVVWHDRLLVAGITDYGREEALNDLKLGALLNLFRPIHVFAKWGPDPGGRKGLFLDAIATRHFAFAVDIGASSLLDQSGRL